MAQRTANPPRACWWLCRSAAPVVSVPCFGLAPSAYALSPGHGWSERASRTWRWQRTLHPVSLIRPAHFGACAGAGRPGGAGETEIVRIVDAALTTATNTQKA